MCKKINWPQIRDASTSYELIGSLICQDKITATKMTSELDTHNLFPYKTKQWSSRSHRWLDKHLFLANTWVYKGHILTLILGLQKWGGKNKQRNVKQKTRKCKARQLPYSSTLCILPIKYLLLYSDSSSSQLFFAFATQNPIKKQNKMPAASMTNLYTFNPTWNP